MSDPDRLGTLVLRRDQESHKDILGQFYVQWGVMNIVGSLIEAYVWRSTLFWVLWIGAGLILQYALVRWKMRALGRSLWERRIVPRIWTGVLLFLPLLIWAFPDVWHLYPVTWINSVVSVWVALGLYATGVFTRRWVLTLGSVVLWLAAPAYFLWPDHALWIFGIGNLLSLVIPGLVSMHDERS